MFWIFLHVLVWRISTVFHFCSTLEYLPPAVEFLFQLSPPLLVKWTRRWQSTRYVFRHGGVGERTTFSYGFWGAWLKQWDYCLGRHIWYSWRSHPDHSKDPPGQDFYRGTEKLINQTNHKSLQMFGFTRTGTPCIWLNVVWSSWIEMKLHFSSSDLIFCQDIDSILGQWLDLWHFSSRH